MRSRQGWRCAPPPIAASALTRPPSWPLCSHAVHAQRRPRPRSLLQVSDFELARRAVAQRLVRLHAVVMLEPSIELAQHAGRVGLRTDPRVITFEGFDERLQPCRSIVQRSREQPVLVDIPTAESLAHCRTESRLHGSYNPILGHAPMLTPRASSLAGVRSKRGAVQVFRSGTVRYRVPAFP